MADSVQWLSQSDYSICIKVIPLKLSYYQTFLKRGVMNIHDMNIIKMQ